MEQWQTIYSSKKLYQAAMVKEYLVASNIDAVLLDQQDSNYLFGEIEVKVANKDLPEAQKIVNDFLKNLN